MKNLIRVITIVTLVILCSSTWATQNSSPVPSALKGYISPTEPVYCIGHNRSLLCTVVTDREFDHVLMSLVARKIGGMTRPIEFVEVKQGVFDVRSFEYGRLSRIYIANNYAYSKIAKQ